MKNLVKKVWNIILFVAVVWIIIIAIVDESHTIWLYSVLLIIGMSALIWDYLQHVRKLSKMTKDKVSRLINMGESLMNVLGVIYEPTIFMCISSEGMESCEKNIIVFAVAGIVVELNCRIYKYKEKLRNLEKTE